MKINKLFSGSKQGRPALPGAVAGMLVALLAAAPWTPATVAADLPNPQLFEASADIDCELTPFGNRLTLGQDAEKINLIGLTSITQPGPLQEWVLPEDPDAPGAPALDASFNTTWAVGAMASTALLDAVRVDLNGDGQDEIAVLTRVSNGHARVGVFGRGSQPGGGINLINTWEVPMSGGAWRGELAVGDLDGSQDGREELAVMLRRSPPSEVAVYILRGREDGGVHDGIGLWAARWSWTPPAGTIGELGIAAGDMLLNGRDQVVVVTESNHTGSGGSNRMFHYHLIEFESPGLPPFPGDANIAASSFASPISNVFRTGHPLGSQNGYAIDDGSISRIKVDTGDVAGDAAQELIVHVDFRLASSGNKRAVGQRLHHFRAWRHPDGLVYGATLARHGSAGLGEEYDHSHLVRNEHYSQDDWDVAVKKIDAHKHDKIVFAHGRFNGEYDELHLHAFRADVDLMANFSFERDGLNVQLNDISAGVGTAPITPPSSGYRWTIVRMFDDTVVYQSNDTNPEVTLDWGNHLIMLRVRQENNGIIRNDFYSNAFYFTSEINTPWPGRPASDRMYQILPNPIYQTVYSGAGSGDIGKVSVDIGDMDRDGKAEIMTLARIGPGHGGGSGLARSIWRVRYPANSTLPPFLEGEHLFQASSIQLPNDSVRGTWVIAADFDGDSVRADLDEDCRRVSEAKAQQLIWIPPYFQHLQATAGRVARFGRNEAQGGSTQSQFGSFTSHDVSAYVGVQLGSDSLGAQASVKATAGYFMQAARGGIIGSQNDFVLDQSKTQQTLGKDALLVTETNSFDCYTYRVFQASDGEDPGSATRVCEINPDRSILGSDPHDWDAFQPAAWAYGSGGHPPPNWAPLHRGWSNLALFKTVTSNTAFETGASRDNLTDGKFTTRVRSQNASVRPYLEIDLGSVQEVSNIRVFPVHGELAGDLRGFRVYTSAHPMPASGLPGGAYVREFAPESVHEMTYDRWNIWTRDASGGAQVEALPLPMRYIRFQHPGPDPVHLNLAQIQVFGDVHVDPPFYPDAVCDPIPGDGLFRAKLWDPGAGQFRDIELHGDLLWSGIQSSEPEAGWLGHGSLLSACSSANLTSHSIWKDTSIGGSALEEWNMSSQNANLIGDTTSFERSVRVGAEFDLTAGAFVALVMGGAYEFSTGVTEEHQSVSYWGSGVEISGGIEGFSNQGLVATCKYNPRPYAYKLVERSNTGYEHTIYAVDYVVPEPAILLPGGASATAWKRNDVPAACLPEPSVADHIFGSGFEVP